jgi:hypothetical protein
MWQPLLRLLEFLTPAGSRTAAHWTTFNVGDPAAADSKLGMGWKRFLSARVLWYAWSPPQGSPWAPYSCVTLFAALDDVLRDCTDCRIGPWHDPQLPDFLKPSAGPPPWTDPKMMVLVDLPGPLSVSVGYYLAATAGYQPVCTFDNWPNKLGVKKPELILGRLLHYAEAMTDLMREKLRPDSPPVWLCDADRLTGARPGPGGFDNRYIIEDRLLPGAQVLRGAGITRIMYVDAEAGAGRAGNQDILHYLDTVGRMGISVRTVSVATPESWRAPENYIRPMVAGETSLAMLGLMRSSAGGFGGFVPQPSSGG